MKQAITKLAGLLIVIFSFSQEMIQNPAKPSRPDAGRVLKLELIFEISDASGNFFFKYPQHFRLDDRKNLYILDEDQLLLFSPDGKFVRNMFKKGQGPGEIDSNSGMVSFVPYRNDLYVYNGNGKIIHFREDGTLVGEIRQSEERLYRLYGVSEKGFLLQGQSQQTFGGPAGFQEIRNQAVLVSPDGSTATFLLDFPSRIYAGSNFGMDWDRFQQVFDPRNASLYVTHTCEYKIVKADLNQKRIVAQFSRAYPRIKYTLPDYMKDIYAKYSPPKKDFENDISDLFLSGDNLWVKTSTVDKGKGQLFDVFNPEGRFIDSFYLDQGMDLQLVDGQFIFITIKDKDENLLVRKYKIIN